MMRRLRKRMITAIIDKTGRLYQGAISPSGDVSFITFSPWMGTHFAILISSGIEWIPVQNIPIRHLHHPLIRNPGLVAQPRIYSILTPSSIDTKPAFYRFVNDATESATMEARNNNIFPWRGVRR